MFKYFLHYNKKGELIGCDKTSEFATKESFEKGKSDWVSQEVEEAAFHWAESKLKGEYT